METAFGIIMRIPGLFIIDYWWQHERNKSFPHSMEVREIINCALVNLILIHGFLLLLLSLQHVRALYTHFISGAILVFLHVISSYYIEMETNKSSESDPDFYKRQIGVLSHNIIFGCIVSKLLKDSTNTILPVYSIYILPVLARILNLPVVILPFLHFFCTFVTILNVLNYVSNQIHNILDCAKVAYMDVLTLTEAQGIGMLFTLLWNKLFVPTHFALFWLLEFSAKLFVNLYQGSKYPWGEEWYIILTTISSICSSPVSLVATSVSVSYLSYFILCSTRAYLQGMSAFFLNNPMHSGWTEGLTLILLSIQTGLIEMKMPARMAVMTIILFIVLSSLLQSMLEMTEPVILALSASRTCSAWRHFKALSLCFFLLIFPLYLTKILSAVFPIDFWMMIVFSSCTLTSVQVLDLLVVHSLFLYDTARSEPWENLDDIVYYTRAITKVLEFFVAIFVVGMGLWEFTSGKWNWVNASILLIHCYFNVWQRLQNGWKSFLLRQEAAKKAKSLPSATAKQLAQLDDVCSICFSGMNLACVTPCQHFFHRTCLRKWLYVQDKCPLCHSVISLSQENVNSTTEEIHRDDEMNQNRLINDLLL